MNRFNACGWGLLLVLVLVVILCIDQLLLFSVGNKQNHFLYCRIWGCSRSPFTAHARHGFLLDPSRSKFLMELAGTSDIEKHNDYKLNANGFRTSAPLSPSGTKMRVNVFGDSFTFGLFLREREHVSAILNAIPSRCTFRNYGVPAFDFRQMVHLSRDTELVAESDVDLFLFISDDIFERLTRLFEVHQFGRDFTSYDLSRELGLKPVLPFKIPLFLVNHFFLFQELEWIVDQRFWDSVDENVLLDRLFRQLQSDTKRTLYFHIPIPQDYKRSADGVHRFRRPGRMAEVTLGERVIKNDSSFEEFEKLFFRGDGHPNPAGARWIASRVMERLKGICYPH